MKRWVFFLTALALLLSCSGEKKVEVCRLQTNYGAMVFRFFEEEAPVTSAHIKELVREGFYDGKDFYRIVKGHVIQTGGGGDAVPPEFNQHKHIVGAVGLARGNDPYSGDSSFYICLAERPHLDGRYTVFGQLVQGFDVLKTIGEVEVDEQFLGPDRIAFHKPRKPVLIEKATIEEMLIPAEKE